MAEQCTENWFANLAALPVFRFAGGPLPSKFTKHHLHRAMQAVLSDHELQHCAQH